MPAGEKKNAPGNRNPEGPRGVANDETPFRAITAYLEALRSATRAWPRTRGTNPRLRGDGLEGDPCAGYRGVGSLHGTFRNYRGGCRKRCRTRRPPPRSPPRAG